ncbi:unnamed protein product [Anisakis simplex]|uniref:Peptidase A1 domain-containing protein n=1 Tax=Anisakis simplex TaxID=6269 RepID=A0A0M3KH08_ANISI|nr:unnamed protein product [Anisakis simplex]
MANGLTSPLGYAQPMEQIFHSSKCPEKVFAFWMNPNEESENGGELTLCGIDHSHYTVTFSTGELAWIPVISSNAWQVPIDAVNIGDQVIGTQMEGLFDTGSALIVVPSAQYYQIVAAVGAQYDGERFWTYCMYVDWQLPLTFTFNGKQYDIPASAYWLTVRNGYLIIHHIEIQCDMLDRP